MKELKILLLALFPFGIFGQTFVGGTGPILDYQTIDVPNTVSLPQTEINTTTFGLETVCINLTHTYLADLTISLVAPDGTVKLLMSSIGGGDDNLVNTCLNTTASVNITNGTAPFTGNFQPMGPMGAVNNGQNPNGTWYLRVSDGYGQDQGAVQDWSITFGSQPANYFQLTESDLPIVVINTNGQTIDNDVKIMADMGIIYNGEGNRNHLSDPFNEYNGKIGIEYRGNYSLSLPQKPYALELVDDLGNSIDSSLIGMPAEHDWLLIANYNDKSFARNVVPFELFESMGHYSVRSRYADVIVNDEYQGIYLLTEKIKRDSNRVDISRLDSTELFGQSVSGGYIIKVDYWNTNDSWLSSYSPIGFPTADVHFVYYYPKANNIMQEQKDYIQTFMYSFEYALYSNYFDHLSLGYRRYINTSSFVDYFIISELTRNNDGYKKSRFLWKDKDHADGSYRKLHAGPVWDFDWSQKDIYWGSQDGSGFMYQDPDQDVNAPGWYIRLLQDTLFANEVRCRYDDLRRNILSLPYIHAKIDSIALKLNESQDWHFQTWGNMGAATGTWEVQSPSQSYAEEITKLKDWYTRRITWLDQNMPGTLNGCSMAGLEELPLDEFVAYPNPFNDELIIETAEVYGKNVSIRLLDQMGREVAKIEGDLTSAKTIQLNGLSELMTGFYLLEIQDGTEKRSIKLTHSR
ncbi:MAG: T9SS type A sorting domain-containing protein [Bacteroidetes bacterium]|nr:MAG: T9SS type A sorting domain-containing protein [Bacteroidota bacterium]